MTGCVYERVSRRNLVDDRGAVLDKRDRHIEDRLDVAVRGRLHKRLRRNAACGGIVLLEGTHQLVLKRENSIIAPGRRLCAFGEGLRHALHRARIEVHETGKLAQRIIIRQEARITGSASREVLVSHTASHS